MPQSALVLLNTESQNQLSRAYYDNDTGEINEIFRQVSDMEAVYTIGHRVPGDSTPVASVTRTDLWTGGEPVKSEVWSKTLSDEEIYPVTDLLLHGGSLWAVFKGWDSDIAYLYQLDPVDGSLISGCEISGPIDYFVTPANLAPAGENKLLIFGGVQNSGGLSVPEGGVWLVDFSTPTAPTVTWSVLISSDNGGDPLMPVDCFVNDGAVVGEKVYVVFQSGYVGGEVTLITTIDLLTGEYGTFSGLPTLTIGDMGGSLYDDGSHAVVDDGLVTMTMWDSPAPTVESITANSTELDATITTTPTDDTGT